MMWQAINFSRRLLYRSALVLLVGIGFWRDNPQAVVQVSTVNQNGNVPRFERETCYKVLRGTFSLFSWFGLPQSRFRCGYLITWKDYDLQEKGGTISLAVMETYTTRNPKPAPVLWLVGGPGGTGFPKNPKQAMQFTDDFGRGWIQFSQRGSHLSESELLCNEYHKAIINNWEMLLQVEQWNPIKQKALSDCRTRLKNKQGIEDSTIFNSEFNAFDVIYLIRSLDYGYGNVNLYGGSYGTLLAQHVLALSPGDVRSVVLDGVAPLGVDWEVDYALNLQNSLDMIFDACINDCQKAYPDLKRSFYSLLDQLANEPVTISVKDKGTTYKNVYLDNYGFLIALGSLLSDSRNIKKVPRIIYKAHEIYESGGRNFDEIGELGSNYYVYERDQQWPWGMYYSVYCTEFAGFDPNNTGSSQVKPQLRVLYDASKQLMEGVCPLYDSDGNSYGNAQITDKHIPTLIFNGKFDPLTPPRYGTQVAKALSIGDEFQFPFKTSSHQKTYSNCANEIMRNFFDDPVQAPDKNSCWKKEDSLVEFELPNEKSGSPWWQEWQKKIADALNQWWQEIQKQIEDTVKQWWQDFQKWLDQWWQDFEKQLIQWFEQQLREWLNQCLPSAVLPLGMVAGVWISRRRKKNRSF